MGNRQRWEKSHLTTKNLIISPNRKFSLDSLTSSAIESVIPSPSNNKFHLITLYKLYFQLQSLLLHIFIGSNFMYTHVILILINQCVFKIVFSMIKALNSQGSPKQNFCFSPHFNAIWKVLLLLMLVFLFFKHPFLFLIL